MIFLPILFSLQEFGVLIDLALFVTEISVRNVLFFGDKSFQVKCEAHDAPVNLTSRFFFEITRQLNLLRLF